MTLPSAADRLASVFRTVLTPPEDRDVATLEYRGIPRWDSVGHMQLVAAVETEFDVMLETEQVIDMSSFAKTLEILHDLGIDTSA